MIAEHLMCMAHSNMALLSSRSSVSMSRKCPQGLPTAAHLDAGLQKVKRARFAASVRLLEDLDEAGVQYLLHHLPAWLQVSSCCPGINVHPSNLLNALVMWKRVTVQGRTCTTYASNAHHPTVELSIIASRHRSVLSHTSQY